MMEGRAAATETAAAHWRANEMANVATMPSLASASGDWDFPSMLRNTSRELMVSQETVHPPRMTLDARTFRDQSTIGRIEDGEMSRAGLDVFHEPASTAGFPDSKLLSVPLFLDSFQEEFPGTSHFSGGSISYVTVAPNLETSVLHPDATSHESRTFSNHTLVNHSSITSPASAFTLSPLSSDTTTTSNRTTSPSPLQPHRPRYRCRKPDCQKTYAGSSERSRHEKKHNCNTSVWKCPAPECAKIRKLFGRSDNCLKHIRKYHPELAAAAIQPIEVLRM